MTLVEQGVPSRPYATAFVAQYESSLLDLSFFDANGVPATPSSIRYRIDNLTTSYEVLGWTSVTPTGVAQTLTITPTQNTIQRQYNERETRQVTVEATVAGLVKREIFPYILVNQNAPA
jgi:hypothetical protein